ncbi:MAG: ubiquinone/menaquinone biosynthesis methyltransferase, partial [Planctomycetes bacterium]|nr:ubiquinone/menaquinone biosynthesis methyltransferase [Planctomycetota bacterium]
ESGVRSQGSEFKTQDPRLWTHDSCVVGTDFCEEMLRLAIAKIKNKCRGRFQTYPYNSGNRIKFIKADTLHLPFPDNTFQVSTVAFGIRNVADLELGIREMTRVISPGGRVVILEFAEPENKVFRLLYDFYFHKILPIIGRLISASKIDAYTYLPSSVQTFPNRWQLKAVMESCGLEDVKIYPRTFGIVNVHVGKKPRLTHLF